MQHAAAETHVQQAAAAATTTTIIDGRLQLLSLFMLLLPIDGKWRQKSTLIDNSIASVCVCVCELECVYVCVCACLSFLCRKATLNWFSFSAVEEIFPASLPQAAAAAAAAACPRWFIATNVARRLRRVATSSLKSKIDKVNFQLEFDDDVASLAAQATHLSFSRENCCGKTWEIALAAAARCTSISIAQSQSEATVCDRWQFIMSNCLLLLLLWGICPVEPVQIGGTDACVTSKLQLKITETLGGRGMRPESERVVCAGNV